ncbi:tryptophan--tRNA ligase [Candidatus Daviesbacteria bacterium]|nr:tryptophan--tRNA ligase [Candidatus Daviesbacteria bacterium]
MRKRILTGDRPTGKLHLGHYVGSLVNRVKLQDEYECFFIIADLHTLTTRPERTGELKENIHQIVVDYLSVGIDPAKAAIYIQSQIPEVAEIALILGMLVGVPRLQRIPTLKEVMRDAKLETASYGLLGYPVLQAADILMVRANLVPVGRDQSSHLEVTRELARKFNDTYPLTGSTSSPQAGSGQVVFPEPDTLIGEVPTLPGTDGQVKMSKSVGNVINLSDSKAMVEEKVMKMYTDPTRIHPNDPGHVKGNPVFVYLDAFAPEHESRRVEEYKKKYQEGRVGDVEVKQFLIEVLNNFLDPIRQRREKYEKDPELVERILQEGTQKARAEAQKTLTEVKKAMKMDYF